jgi:hypothetical protein
MLLVGLLLAASCVDYSDYPTGFSSPPRSYDYSNATILHYLGGEWAGTISCQWGIPDTAEINLSLGEEATGYNVWIEILAEFASDNPTYPRTDSIRASSAPGGGSSWGPDGYTYECSFNVAGLWYGRLAADQPDTVLSGTMFGMLQHYMADTAFTLEPDSAMLPGGLLQVKGATAGNGVFEVSPDSTSILRYRWNIKRVSPGAGGI